MMDRADNAPAGPDTSGTFSTEKVFDYFAGEVFDKLDSETRDFLLIASFLPRMTPETSAKLTDNEQAGKILSGRLFFSLCRPPLASLPLTLGLTPVSS